MTSKLLRIAGHEVWAMYDQKSEIVELPTGQRVRLDSVFNLELDPISLGELPLCKAIQVESIFHLMEEKIKRCIEQELN